MAKVMTSEGGVLSTQVIVDKPKRPPGTAAPVDMKAGAGAPPVVDGPGERAEPKADAKESEVKTPEEPVLEPEDHDLPERARRRIGKYSVAAKQEAALRQAAEAEAAESERFAEQLFNEREEWRKKAEAAEAKAAQIEQNKPKVPEFIAPDENDPKYKNDKGEFLWKQFSTDNAAYEAKKAIAEDRKARAEAEAAAAKAAADAQFEQRIKQAIEKNKDWREVVGNSPVQLQNEALAYIAQSEYGTDLAYFLAKHPEEAARIKALHPIRAIAELGKIETGFEKPAETPAPAAATSKTVERPGAPAPITPISTSGAGSINVDPAKMDFKQLRAYERQRAKEKGRR
jgi:flagellar hook-basal body complex protein FliE